MMSMQFIQQWFKNKSDRKTTAKGLYQAALMQSRCPEFYDSLGVADTTDGRFDLLSLHVGVMIGALDNLERDGKKLSQSLFDAMFKRMDLDLREMGVGDLGVPKHMKRMMKAFHGRAHAYKQALDKIDIPALEMAIAKNIYRMPEPSTANMMPQGTQELTDYTLRMNAMMGGMTLDDFKALGLTYPEIIPEMKTKRSA